MQEFDWKKERENYRAKLDEKTPEKSSSSAAPAAQDDKKSMAQQIIEADENRRQKQRIIIIAASILIIIALGVGAAIYFKKQDSTVDGAVAGTAVAQTAEEKDSMEFTDIAEKYKHAVGVVAIRYEFANGKNIVSPIGTAWAFSGDKFATNAHVANGVRDCLLNEVLSYLIVDIKAAGCQNIEEFKKKVGEKKLNELVSKYSEMVNKRIVNVEALILINGEKNKSIPVEKIAVHRDYGRVNATTVPDFAVLMIAGKHDCFFPLADVETLHKLKSGDPIAYLGFPMENLLSDNINLESPVATMQIGNITSVSGFDLKNYGPEGNQCIRHNLPSAGGASGSPVFNNKGEIIAIHFGGNYSLKADEKIGRPRVQSAALINFACRVDLLDGVGEAVDIRKFIRKP